MLAAVSERDEPVRVVRGNPTAEEVAALVGVLMSPRRTWTAPDGPAAPSRWRASGLPAGEHRPGPGAWRASALPR
jgi:hypothetical protein